MTREEKELLFTDLCSRLPYHVRLKVWLKDGTTEEGVLDLAHNYSDVLRDAFYYNKIKDIKPYLRPMSSMTEEEFQELHSICPHSAFNKTNVPEWIVGICGSDYGRISRIDEISKLINFLNAHHFDYRGLIEQGLAIEAPEGMYNS